MKAAPFLWLTQATMRSGLCALGLTILVPASVRGQTLPAPPLLDDFFALAARDEKTSDAAARRLGLVWKDSYAAMVIDLARFFRPARPEETSDIDRLSIDDDGPTAPPQGATREQPSVASARSPEERIRARLMRFLAKQTRKSFGDNLKLWRKWSWSLPSDPHPEYARFKARLYANVDPRMAPFFEATTRPRIRLDEVDWGGVGVNGIPPLDQPKVMNAADAKFMGDKNVVFGLVINGEARAYPKRILAWHEMALDTLGGVELAVVYCTLCGTVIPYETVIGPRSFKLGTSGLLYRSNKLMFDHETKSLWSTIEGRPVLGPLAESDFVLKYRPVVTTSWREWKTSHPETTVLSLDTGHERDYREGAAYRTYFSHDDLMFEVPVEDRRLKRKAEVVTFLAGREQQIPLALDAAFLKRNPVHVFATGGADYVVLTTEGGANRIYAGQGTRFVRASDLEVFDEEGRAWSIMEDRLQSPTGDVRLRQPARRTFWFAWISQYPGTQLIK